MVRTLKPSRKVLTETAALVCCGGRIKDPLKPSRKILTETAALVCCGGRIKDPLESDENTVP